MFRVYWITCNPGPKHIESCKLCLLIREELLLTCTYLGLTAGLTLWFDDSAKAIHVFFGKRSLRLASYSSIPCRSFVQVGP